MPSLPLLSRFLPVAFALAGMLTASAQESAPAVPAVDPAATAIWRLHIEGMGDRGRGARPIDFAEVSGKALEFFEKYPDERRVSGILFNLTNFAAWIEGPDAARLAREWRLHLRVALADALRDRSWPDNVWAGLQYAAAKNEIALQMAESGQPDLAELKRRLDLIAARAETQSYYTFLQQEYITQLGRFAPDRLVSHLEVLASNAHTDLAALGKGQLAIVALRTQPMDLKFTAVDGTEVDLAQLRGKVVLIDCWATWCVPCIKELPNIKAALAKWGDKGFAVIGISFDRPADREKLVKFIQDEKLDWPHWFNAAGGPNPFGRTYNIRSIPATFLLDRNGLLITTETHGKLLDEALEKLLGG